jgi:hypothetical protein
MRLPLARRRRRPQGPPVPFLVGANRSGTTLLRLMLDAHPELAIPPETHFVPELIKLLDADGGSPEAALRLINAQREWKDFGFSEGELLERLRALPRLDAEAVIRAFFGAYAQRHGKPRWGDKTPAYMMHMKAIQRTIPEARFIHLIRDGRDVALSRMDQRRRRGLDGPPADQVARQWSKRIARARAQAPRRRHYMEARYEDLVLDTEAILRGISGFLELDFDAAMLDYHERAEQRLSEMVHELPARGRRPHQPARHRLDIHALTREPPRTDRVARWKTRMEDADRVAFEAVAGVLLSELGYEVEDRPGESAADADPSRSEVSP